MDEEDDDVHDTCRSKISRFRKKFRSAHDQSFGTGGGDTFISSDDVVNTRRLHSRWHEHDDLELALRQLDDNKIQAMPLKFWKDMVIRVQYLIDTNRLLRADVAHLRSQHHCPLHTCKYSSGCLAQEYYTTPITPANHDECDRRCQYLEEEIESLKKERAQLRQQNSSVHDLIRSIGQRQVTLQRDLMNSCQLEAENAMQRRLLSKLSSERDALVSVPIYDVPFPVPQ
ncbi:unnamed protein product [Hymenolepis diminuta]|uniref:Uncharacterized protein n=1 Tax=Hymenolepis diminuta TaxID=6216 RepID=A0A564YL60_HYMDI|nr:unnamed protein product [Hymenolepis diminuta]